MKLKKINKKSAITYFCCFLVIFILSYAAIFDITPFGLAFSSAAVFLGLNPFAIGAMLIFSTLPFLNGYITLCALYAAVILILCSFICKKISAKPYCVFVPSLIASVGQIVYMSLNHFGFYKIFLYLILLLGFTSVCYCFCVPALVKKFEYSFLQHEVICGFVLLTALACGLTCFAIGKFNPLYIAFALFIPLSFRILGAAYTLTAAICLGAGAALGGADVSLIGAFAFTAMLTMIFEKGKKFFMPTVTLMSYAAFALFFNTEYESLLYSVIGLAAGGVIYMFIPSKVTARVGEFLHNDFDRTSLRYIVNQSRYETGNSLASLGRIFGEMALVMRSSETKNTASIKSVAEIVRADVCEKCSKYSDCKRIPAMERGLNELCEASMEKGRAGVGDLPTPITQYCCNIAQLMASAADVSAKASHLNEKADTENKAREIVAGQLKGLSDILDEMGRKSSLPFSYDTDLGKRITEELLYMGIVCSEALVTGVDEPEEITLVILSSCEAENEKIEVCINKCLKKRFGVVKREDSILSGWVIVELKRAPAYDALFGFAGKTKDGSEVSGDTHSFEKLTHDKFMMAMCDGMGSGITARNFSETTISLIESFYKAGFDHKLVLDNVNKFLSIGNAEIFSAVDVCVADLTNGNADIIKIGSPAGYLKTSDSIVKLTGEALPMGVLDEMKPTVKSISMSPGDILIIMSDGVADAFGSEALDDYINNLPAINPSELCMTIIEQALKNSGGKARDDMSVAAFKLFYSRKY